MGKRQYQVVLDYIKSRLTGPDLISLSEPILICLAFN